MAPNITAWKVTKLREQPREFGQPVNDVCSELIEQINEQLKKERNNAQAGNNDFDNLARVFNNLENMTVAELQNELIKYQLPYIGRTKTELLHKLLSYFEDRNTAPPNFDFVENRPLKIMMVAEKPDMALELSMVLAKAFRSLIKKEPSSSIYDPPIYKFKGQFYGYPANFRMTATFGHIFTQDFGQNTTRRQKKELFDATIVNIEVSPDQKLPDKLAEIAEGCDALVLWLDCDLEGEAICFEVIDCVKKKLNKPPEPQNVMDVVYRAKFSAADEAVTAIRNLVKPDRGLYLAAVAKHYLDLQNGVGFSLFQTDFLRGWFPNREIQHLSFGPCQTPCLAFVVKRYLKVQSHVVPYIWKIVLTLKHLHGELQLLSEPIKCKETAEQLYKQIEIEILCKVVEVKRTNHIKEPPPGLNTVELLKIASKHYGIGPKEAMFAAENLYRKGLISYPRTETTKYPNYLEVTQIKNHIRRYVRVIERGEVPINWKLVVVNDDVFNRGIDNGDHPPIIPRRKPINCNLSRDEKTIYELICRHFLASFMPAQRYHSETTIFSAGNMTFERRIQEVDNYGFAKVLPWEKAQNIYDGFTNTINNGEYVKIEGVKMLKTKGPLPTLLTEAELIGKMEKHSIGTDASIPSHISTIQERKYATVDEETRMLTPTKLGIELIIAYQACVPKLVEPTLRAEVEAQIMKIARGEKEFEEVINHVLRDFSEQLSILQQNFGRFSQNFETCFEHKKPDDSCGKDHDPQSLNYEPINDCKCSRISYKKTDYASFQPTYEDTHNLHFMSSRHRQSHFAAPTRGIQPSTEGTRSFDDQEW